MKKYLSVVLCVLITQLLVSGCGRKDNTVTFNPATHFNSEKMNAEKFVQKVDTFVVILDASDSMEKVYIKNKKERKIDTAVHFLNSLFATMPDLEFTAGLRAFGMPANAHNDNTPILYWLTESSRSGIAKSLDQVKTGRNHASSLALALNRTADTLVAVDSQPSRDRKTLANVGVDATDKAFKANRGKIAVIVVSDGIDSPTQALAAAKHLKARYKNRLNLYTVTAGYDETGIDKMRALANAGGGFAVRANDLAAAADMQTFIEKIFVSPDADSDGVADADDKCPGSPAGVMANADGCTPDTDNDGVYDYLDRCPRTPDRLAVNAMGCPADTDADGKYDDQDQSPNTPEWINDLSWGSASPESRYLWFDVNAYEIRPWMYAVLNDYVAFLNIHPNAVLNVQGHASAVGSSNQNNDLSKRRANAAKAYLLNAGVSPSQLHVTYHGTKMPMADSKTVLGRNLNRRVELSLSK